MLRPRRGLRAPACLIAGFVAATLTACGGSSGAAPAPTATRAAANPQQPSGEDAPAELQGTWRLMSKGPEKGLLFVISDRHYRVPARLAHGDLAVDGDEILFFNATICGLTLPQGIGRYRWTVKGNRLRFDPIEEDPCGGRSDILDGTAYERVG